MNASRVKETIGVYNQTADVRLNKRRECRLGLLHELVAKGTVIGFLVNPSNPNTTRDAEDAQAAAEQLGHKLITVRTSSIAEIDTAFGPEHW